MEQKQKRKMNNRGFSLVELLIVMAIAGVVTILVGGLMVNGSQWYTGETAKADLQNEVQTINTKLQKTLMEATHLDIHMDQGVLYILTGEPVITEDGGNITSSWNNNENFTAKAIIVYEEHVYISDFYWPPSIIKNAGEDSDLRGYEVTNYLKEDSFSVKVQNTLESPEGSAVVTTEAPIIVEIEYALEKNRKTTRSSYEVTLRNSEVMEKIKVWQDEAYGEVIVQ